MSKARPFYIIERCPDCGRKVQAERNTDHGSARMWDHGKPLCKGSGQNPYRYQWGKMRVLAFLRIDPQQGNH